MGRGGAGDAPAPHDHRRAHAAAAPARAQPPAAARDPAPPAAALQAPPPRRRAARPRRPARARRARARADRRRAVADQRDLPAVPRRPERRGQGDGPQRLRRRPHRRDPGVGRRDRLGAAVRGQRDGHDAPRQAAPGQVPAAARDEQRRGDRGADAGPAGEGGQDLLLHDPRGPLAAGEHPGSSTRPFSGDYGKATTDPRAAAAGAAPRRRRATRARSRASCSPRPTR